MEQKNVTISDSGRVRVPENVSMSPFEIAVLFGVYPQAIHANIRAILKSGVVRTDNSGTMMLKGGIVMPLVFGLDMVTALAFRVDSLKANMFRRWVMNKINAGKKPQQEHVLINFSDKTIS